MCQSTVDARLQMSVCKDLAGRRAPVALKPATPYYKLGLQTPLIHLRLFHPDDFSRAQYDR